MEKASGRFKGVLMLVLLMLIATRLTWLQTSEMPVDISSSFYRTGLRMEETLKAYCPIAPEATFPIPASMAIKPDAVPPSPLAGELSLGLAGLMVIKCQLGRLEVDDFSRWNAWIYLGATLFSALTARLLTSSWTAGLLAAVAVLSRGTVQSQSMLAAPEPFAALFVSLSCCAFVLFLRSLWRPWIGVCVLAWTAAFLFVPSLWISLCAGCLLLAVCVLLKPSAIDHKRRPGPIETVEFQDLRQAQTRRAWLLLSTEALGFLVILTLVLYRIAPSSLPFQAVRNFAAESPSAVTFIASLFSVVGDGVMTNLPRHIGELDGHTVLALFMMLIQLFTAGRLRAANRSGTFIFLVLCGSQLLFCLLQESLLRLSGPDGRSVLIPSAKAFEPIYFAWSTAAAWRILDMLSGYRLSTSGWSIRGRVNM